MQQVRIERGKASHKGVVRSGNEDSLLALELSLAGDPEGTFVGLYAVADGVGGRDDGEVASNVALRALSERIVQSIILPGLWARHDWPGREVTLRLLGEAVQAANREVFVRGQNKGNGMGTTVTALLIAGSTAFAANVGDSRLYLIRRGLLTQLTRDHSLVAELVAAGELTRDEVYTHPRRNVITRCLGMRHDLEVDLYTEELNPGDVFLLCSDGLWEMVRDDGIREALQESPDPQMACEQLVRIANQNGGVDNISVIVVNASPARKAE